MDGPFPEMPNRARIGKDAQLNSGGPSKGFATMRNAALALLLLALTSMPASAQQESWGSKLFSELNHDFGSVPRGTQLYYKFKITNIYAVPLNISTRVGCNCVTVTPQSLTVQPRAETYLDISMDGTRFSGPKTVDIFVTIGNGAEFHSSAQLRVQAFGRTDVVLNPGQIAFGVVTRGQPTTPLSLDVEYAGGLAWKVEEVVKHNAPFDVTFKELYREPGRVGYRVTAMVKPDAPSGTHKSEIALKTNDPSGPLVPVLLDATVKSNLEVVPGTAYFGAMKVGESKSLRVLVRGTKPFKITAIDGAGEGITAAVPTTAAAQVQFVQIDCKPAKPADLRRTLTIKTDLEKESPLSLLIEGVAAQ